MELTHLYQESDLWDLGVVHSAVLLDASLHVHTLYSHFG